MNSALEVRPLFQLMTDYKDHELRQAFFECQQFKDGNGFPKEGVVRRIHADICLKFYNTKPSDTEQSYPIHVMPELIYHEICRRLYGSNMEVSQIDMYSYEVLTDWFRRLMWNRLIENHNKGGWQEEDHSYLQSHLCRAALELDSMVLEGEDPNKIANKAADIANYAMMIADNAKAKQESAS